MLPILRSRPSRMLVALLCALVLSRMPAPVFGEDAASTIIKTEEAAALAATAPDIDRCLCVLAIGTLIHDPAAIEAPNHSLIESAILRL
jgi:hypothetical protein